MTTIPQTAFSKIIGAFKTSFSNPKLLLTLVATYCLLIVTSYFIVLPFTTATLLAQNLLALPMLLVTPIMMVFYFKLAVYNFEKTTPALPFSYLKEAFSLGIKRYFRITLAAIVFTIIAGSPMLPGLILGGIFNATEDPGTLLSVTFVTLALAGFITTIFLSIRFALIFFIAINENLPLFASFSHASYRMHGLKWQYLRTIGLYVILMAAFTLPVTSLITGLHPLLFSLFEAIFTALATVISYQIYYYFYIQTRDKA